MLTLTYLKHSGFMLELSAAVLIFDCYADPSGAVADRLGRTDKPAVYFVTHWHADHWNAGILASAADDPGRVTYVIDRDTARAHLTPAQRAGIRLIETADGARLAADVLRVPGLRSVSVFGSNDEGVSYVVDTADGLIYHAGDLNDWDWQDADSPRMQAYYRSELDKIAAACAGRVFDLAMVPVDLRLGDRAFSGAEIFAASLPVTHLVPMHLNGGDSLPQQLAGRLGCRYQAAGSADDPAVVQAAERPDRMPAAVIGMTGPGQRAILLAPGSA